MKNWIVCSSSLILFLSLFILFLLVPFSSQSQSLKYKNLKSGTPAPAFLYSSSLNQDSTSPAKNTVYPDPYSVLYKSMIIPGWGQVVNRQIWKVPIIYGLLGGLAWYSVYLNKKYHDFRAAYYNMSHENQTGFRFGPTPAYISENTPLPQLRTIRNSYRNRRDLVYIGIAVAYGLNIVDAYVFAHMRSFDVSEDLSMKTGLKPGVTGWAVVPGITLSIDLITK